MQDKQAIGILTAILEKYPLTDAEREALKSAIGIMGWTKLIDAKLEARAKRREREIE